MRKLISLPAIVAAALLTVSVTASDSANIISNASPAEKMVKCSACKGKGITVIETGAMDCHICNGKGKVRQGIRMVKCTTCKGKGQIPWERTGTCSACSGIGKVPKK